MAESRLRLRHLHQNHGRPLVVRPVEPGVRQAILACAYPEADWKVGGAWKIVYSDGRILDTGEIVEFEPNKRLAIRWRNEFMPELKAEGYSLCTMELEPTGEAVKLTVTHTMEREGSKFIGAVSDGWPKILSNLKSLLETGTVILPAKELAK